MIMLLYMRYTIVEMLVGLRHMILSVSTNGRSNRKLTTSFLLYPHGMIWLLI
jgi:hypothetical protein